MIVEHDKCRTGSVGGGCDHRHPAVFGHALDSPIESAPASTTVTREVNAPVIRAHPDRAGFQRAGCDGHDGRVVFGGRDIGSKAATFPEGLPLRVIGSQITADHGPGRSPVSGLVYKLAAVVNGGRIERILGNGGVPVESELNARCLRCRAD